MSASSGAGRPSKFSNKAPEDILNQRGLDKINEGLRNLGMLVQPAPVCNLLAGPEGVQSAVAAGKRQAAEVHKASVALDIKMPA